MSSVSIGELSDRSPALRLDSPGVTRLRGPGLTLHGQGQNCLASMSVYGLRATPGQYRLTQRGEVSLQRSSPDPHNRAHSDVRISVTSRTRSSSTSPGSTTSNLRPDADSTASTYSTPNLANQSLCSTTTVMTFRSRSKVNSFPRRPFSSGPTSVTTRTTGRSRPVAQVVTRVPAVQGLGAGPPATHRRIRRSHQPAAWPWLVNEGQPANTGRSDGKFPFPKPLVRGDRVHPVSQQPPASSSLSHLSLTRKQQVINPYLTQILLSAVRAAMVTAAVGVVRPAL